LIFCAAERKKHGSEIRADKGKSSWLPRPAPKRKNKEMTIAVGKRRLAEGLAERLREKRTIVIPFDQTAGRRGGKKKRKKKRGTAHSSSSYKKKGEGVCVK